MLIAYWMEYRPGYQGTCFYVEEYQLGSPVKECQKSRLQLK